MRSVPAAHGNYSVSWLLSFLLFFVILSIYPCHPERSPPGVCHPERSEGSDLGTPFAIPGAAKNLGEAATDGIWIVFG